MEQKIKFIVSKISAILFPIIDTIIIPIESIIKVKEVPHKILD